MSVAWIFGIALAVFAVYLAVQFWRYRGSDTWPTTDGVSEGDPEIHSWGESPSLYAIVFYSYSVAGERYSGEWKSPSFSTEAELRAFLAANLPKGTAVRVRYRPGKAKVSALEFHASASADGLIKLDI